MLDLHCLSFNLVDNIPERRCYADKVEILQTVKNFASRPSNNRSSPSEPFSSNQSFSEHPIKRFLTLSTGYCVKDGEVHLDETCHIFCPVQGRLPAEPCTSRNGYGPAKASLQRSGKKSLYFFLSAWQLIFLVGSPLNCACSSIGFATYLKWGLNGGWGAKDLS